MPAFLLLCAVLGLPLGLAYSFSLQPEAVWLARCLLALLAAAGGLWSGARLLSGALRALWLVGGSLALAAFQGARLISYFFQGEGFNARFFFHFGPNALAEGGAAYVAELGVLGGYFFGVALCAAWALHRLPPTPARGWQRALPLLALSAFPLLDPDAHTLALLGLRDVQQQEVAAVLADLDWEGLGLDPAALEPQRGAAQPGKHLLLIYLEGLETLYTDETVFPGLTPNLNALAREGLRFTGLHQTEGTSWTIGGLLASQCGTPLLSLRGGGGNDLMQAGFLNRARCLGDVLADAGYRQVFMGGASPAFAGKGVFLEAHGYDTVLGREELAPLLGDASYQTGWGLFDDSLFALAARRYAELGAADGPFHLSLLTLDSHHPEGQPSASCPDYAPADNSILDAVHCTDHLLGRLFDELSRQPAWEDTLVVLLSDHLAMRNAAYPLFPPDYERTLLLQIQGAGQGEIATPGTHMDIAPTLLDLLGVQHDTRFLAGRSLLAAEGRPHAPTLADAPERLSALARINSELLSGGISRLCEAPQPLSLKDGTLHLAGREQALSLAGQPLPLEVLADSHAWLVRLSDDGAVRETLTLYRENLPHALALQPEASWLLLAPAPGLSAPGSSSTRMTTPAGDAMALWMGRGRRALLIEHAVAGADLNLSAATCSTALAALGPGLQRSGLADFPVSTAPAFAANCAATADAALRDGELLRLPRVAFDALWLSGELVAEGEGRWRLQSQTVLGAIGADMDDAAACHAWFSGSALVIPRLRGGEGPLRLRLLPGAGDRVFEEMLD